MDETIGFQQILKEIPEGWIDELGMSLPREREFDEVLTGWREYMRTKPGSRAKGDARAKLNSFTVKNGDVPAGMTNVDVMGTYVVGTVPKNKKDGLRKAKRVLGEEMYASSLVEGTNATLKDMGFKLNDSNDYPTRGSALLAIECDSLSSKGPYDNGSEETAIKTVDTVLTSASKIHAIDDRLLPSLEHALNRRRNEYKRYVTPNLAPEFEHYVNYMQSRGLSNTMRGFPFYSSGKTPLKGHHYDLAYLMFRSKVPGYKFGMEAREKVLKSKPTIDEFIQMVMVHLSSDLGLKLSDWYSLWHSIIIPISRDQGSPFICGTKDGYLTYTGDRKDRKFRLVTPISGFVQAWLIMCSRDLVKVAPMTDGRIGLQDPETNRRRMNDFIRTAAELERIIISTDFSGYDSTLSSQLMNAHSATYATLYDNPVVKDALAMAGVIASQKIMVLPTSTNDEGKPYNLFKHEVMQEVKGNRNFTTRRIAAQLSGKASKSLRKQLKESENSFDYMARAFYVYKGYLPSGLILTNTLGSDCTLTFCRDLVPTYLSLERVMEVPDSQLNAIASGDDAAQEVLKSVYDRIGYSALLEALEKAFSACGMVVNAKKQLKILFRGYPLVDFLQTVYTQMYDFDNQVGYRKFLRQVTSLPYKERYSMLYMVLQWVIVIGKLDSALCDENYEFAARVMAYAGQAMNAAANRKAYKPAVPISFHNKSNSLFWNDKYAVNESVYGGLEQLIGLDKQYRGGLIAALVKHSLGHTTQVELLNEFDEELETRAPHRAELARALFASLGADMDPELKKDYRSQDASSYVSYVSNFLQKLEEFGGVSVNSLVLDEPLVGGEVQHQEADLSDVAENDVDIIGENSDS